MLFVLNTGLLTTATIGLYDEGALPSCAAADELLKPQTLNPGSFGNFMPWGVPLSNGLAVKMSANPADPIKIGWM